MKNKIITTILCFGVLLFGSISANGATLTVTKIADTSDLVCNTDCSLREAIFAAAASGDTIEFASPLFDTLQTINLNAGLGELSVNKTLTINGKGASLIRISGFGSSRVFSNVGGNLTLKNLTVIDGRVAGSNNIGGGIYNDNASSLIISDCNIAGNRVQTSGNARGGGIYNAAGGYTEIVRSTIFNNVVSGGLSKEGGGIANFGTLVVRDSTFFNNSASGGNQNTGGAIKNRGDASLTNTTISSNTVGGGTFNEGGGIFNDSGNLTVINVTITLNTNGIFTTNGTSVINTIISGNIGANLTGGLAVNSANFINGDARLAPLASNGGTTQTHALLSDSPAINVGNICVLTANGCGTGNEALTNDQRGNGFPRLQNTAVDIGAFESARGVVLNSNSSGAGSLQQLIADAATGDTITFDASVFTSPRTITLSGGEIVINKNLTLIGTGANFVTIDAANVGRIFNIQPGFTFNASGVKITRGNVGGANGGCVYVYGVFNLTNGEISNCSANFGGAIYNDPTGTTNLTGSLLRSNHASTHGGAIFSDALLSLTNSTLQNNTADNAGGGMFLEVGRTTNITNSEIQGNVATASGGGIYNLGTINLTSSTIDGNTAQTGGGEFNDGTTFLFESTVSGNRATTGKGGGIYNANGRITHLLNATITNNRSDGFAAAGIWNENSTPTTVRVRNTIIAGNISGNGNPVDYTGGIVDLGNNLINVSNIGLAPLGNYGGATPTHALLSNSPALNAGDNCVLTANTCGIAHSAFANDQRGTNAPRKIGAFVDIGAFESNITFNQTSLPNGNPTLFYSQTLSATRSTNFVGFSMPENTDNSEAAMIAPFTFSVVPVAGQSLPPGITLSSGGLLSGTPTTAGTYNFIVKATDTDGIAGVRQYSMQIFVPTASTVLISGRVFTPSGRGLANAFVVMTNQNGDSVRTRTTQLGYYRFENVQSGETYIFSVASKRYQFAPQTITVNEDLTGLNLTAIQ